MTATDHDGMMMRVGESVLEQTAEFAVTVDSSIFFFHIKDKPNKNENEYQILIDRVDEN